MPRKFFLGRDNTLEFRRADRSVSTTLDENGVLVDASGAAPALPSFDNLSRPDAADVAAGSAIWNTDDNAPNWSDGSDWRDASGSVT